jgi:hypothetical protein
MCPDILIYTYIIMLIGLPVFPAMLSFKVVATSSAVVLNPKFGMVGILLEEQIAR